MKTNPYQERVELGGRAVRISFAERREKSKQRLIFVDVEIWSGDLKKSEIVRMALDTGAQVSEVDVSVLERLGYTADRDGARPSRVHNGQHWVEGYVSPIKQCRIEDIILKDLKMNMTELDPQLEFRGLLGLNFLEALSSLSIDWKSGVLELCPS